MGNHINNKLTHYKGFWTSCSDTKNKRSGVGLLVNNKWEKYISTVKRSLNYSIVITLYSWISIQKFPFIIGSVFVGQNQYLNWQLYIIYFKGVSLIIAQL